MTMFPIKPGVRQRILAEIKRQGRMPPLGGGGEKYLLRDDFMDTLAAGSVNGTPATPGPGVRSVLDTENKLSVGSGLLSFSGGKVAPAWGDPSLSYGAITRAAGRVMVLKTATSNRIRGDFSKSANANNGEDGFQGIYDPGIGTSFTVNTGGLILGSKTSGVYYKCALIMRASGLFWFVTGGAEYPTTWRLLHFTAVGNTASLYPSFMNYNGSPTFDNIRIPQALWLPTPLASDGMTSATITNGLGHAEGVTGGIGAGGGSIPWAVAATWSVAGGVALNTPVQGAEENSGALVVGTWYAITATQANYFYAGCAIGDHFRATAATALDANNKVKAFAAAELFRPLNTPFTADVVARVTSVARTDRTSRGIAIRLDDPAVPTQGIIARFDGLGNISVVEFSGATYTQLFTAVKAWAASDILQLIADGVNVRLVHITSAGIATLIGSSATATITTGNYHGLFSTDPGNTLDNLCIYSRGTDNSYSILDRWSK